VGTYSVVVIGQGDQLTFLLAGEQRAGQPVCALPFLASGNTATLPSPSACLTAAADNSCVTTIQTFVGGSASLQGGTLTLQLQDVFVEPEPADAGCGQWQQANRNTVRVDSLTATMRRTSDAG
jgi:hypothetical protein